MKRRTDLTGQRFGRLVAAEPIARPAGMTGTGWWRLDCDCGGEHRSTLGNLRAAQREGRAMSCAGCRTERRGVPRGPVGPNRPRSEATGYKNAHRRVREARGRAADHLCRCGQPAIDWAYLHGATSEAIGRVRTGGQDYALAYSNDPAHYAPMCRSCHRAFDGAASFIAALGRAA